MTDSHNKVTFQYSSLCAPGGIEKALARLKQGDPELLEMAIRFLEDEPRFFRSGYLAEDILRRLKHLDLTPDQISRLVKVILKSISGGGRRRFAQCARLAAVIVDRRIESGATEMLGDSDVEVKRRAKHTLDLLKEKRKANPPSDRTR